MYRSRGYATIRRLSTVVLVVCLLPVFTNELANADGKVVPLRNYKGSLEERAQEAIIIFNSSRVPGEATEDLILKIRVEGDAEEFAWIVPFPTAPDTQPEDPKLFSELFRYCQLRQRPSRSPKSDGANSAEAKPKSAADRVHVISQKVAGKFLVTVVKEQESGSLNEWLEQNGYQTLEGGEDVIEFYRAKGYVFACIKVTDVARAEHAGNNESLALHPLRFSFKTGGRDGIYFPMRMTGLQTKPFDVNLYVFYSAWLNDDLSQFGYVHRGFRLLHRDWDTSRCEPNAGKAWSAPDTDPFLGPLAGTFPTVTKLFQKLHPGRRYYLTNIAARNLEPADVRQWTDDLWMFPYYTDRAMVPYDVRADGPARYAWTGLEVSEDGRDTEVADAVDRRNQMPVIVTTGLVLLMLVVAGVVWLARRPKRFA